MRMRMRIDTDTAPLDFGRGGPQSERQGKARPSSPSKRKCKRVQQHLIEPFDRTTPHRSFHDLLLAPRMMRRSPLRIPHG